VCPGGQGGRWAGEVAVGGGLRRVEPRRHPPDRHLPGRWLILRLTFDVNPFLGSPYLQRWTSCPEFPATASPGYGFRPPLAALPAIDRRRGSDSAEHRPRPVAAMAPDAMLNNLALVTGGARFATRDRLLPFEGCSQLD